MPASFNYEEIKQQMERLAEILEKTLVSKIIQTSEEQIETLNVLIDAQKDFYYEKEIEACEETIKKVREVVGDTPIVIDYLMHPRPLGLAKLLLIHGFNVKAVYLDGISPEEKDAFDWLQECAPELELIATIQVKMRVLPRGGEEEVLAIGQKAAYFSRSRHFVNLVQGEGLYGFDGIRRTAELMMEAYREEKDTEQLVVQKGWGCECCL